MVGVEDEYGRRERKTVITNSLKCGKKIMLLSFIENRLQELLTYTNQTK